MSRPSGTAPLLVALLSFGIGVALAYWGGMLEVGVAASSTGDADRPSYPLVVVLLGTLIGTAGPLVGIGWYLRRRVPMTGRLHRGQALWIGLAWGTVAYFLASSLNGLAGMFVGGNVAPGFIEEFLKLLLPVILLLSSRSYRTPQLGVWLVFVSSAWFALLEGISYIVTAIDPVLNGGPVPSDEAFDTSMSVVVRVIAEASHPLITVGAAIIIWLAATRFSAAKAVGIGILAYLAAALIHGLNDAVISGPIREWSVPLSVALLAVYVIAILVFWFRPQVLRLQAYDVADDAPSARTAARSSTEEGRTS